MMAANAQDWNFVNSFSCSTGRQHAVVFDGENIYTAAWGKSSTVLSMFYKYDLEGNLLDEFDVAGVTKEDQFVRDMTFDGTYFYGCDAHSGKIWCYDLHNKILVGAIETSLNELGTCTYDPENDAFWVGERATGSSPSLDAAAFFGVEGDDIRSFASEKHLFETAQRGIGKISSNYLPASATQARAWFADFLQKDVHYNKQISKVFRFVHCSQQNITIFARK